MVAQRGFGVGEGKAAFGRVSLVAFLLLAMGTGACNSKGSTGSGTAGSTGLAGASGGGIAGSFGSGAAGASGSGAAGSSGSGAAGSSGSGAAGSSGSGTAGAPGSAGSAATSVAGSSGIGGASEVAGSSGTAGSSGAGTGGASVDAGTPLDAPVDAAADAALDAAPQTTIVSAVPAQATPIDVLLLVDRSGSMEENLLGMLCTGGCDAGAGCASSCGASSKWTILSDWLTAFLPTTETTVNWGLKLFGSSGSGCAVSLGVEVPPLPMNAAAISSRIAATTTGSQTPTTAAVQGAADYLSTIVDGAPKFILLATDGVPNCGVDVCAPGVAMSAQCDDANAIQAIRRAHDERGVPTFVLGLGVTSSPGEGTLAQMAVAGGYPRATTPAYYPVDATGDLATMFSGITAAAGNCRFRLSPAIDPATTRITGVQADGVLLPASAYVLTGANEIQLGGQTCADYMAGKIKTVAATTTRS